MHRNDHRATGRRYPSISSGIGTFDRRFPAPRTATPGSGFSPQRITGAAPGPLTVATRLSPVVTLGGAISRSAGPAAPKEPARSAATCPATAG